MLVGAPQQSEIKIRYSQSIPMSRRRWEKTQDGLAHPNRTHVIEILSAAYEHSADKYMPTYTNHRWSISLSAVRSEELLNVRNLLGAEGYARLLTWLVDTNQVCWQGRRP